jgi:hypothetical protein
MCSSVLTSFFDIIELIFWVDDFSTLTIFSSFLASVWGYS